MNTTLTQKAYYEVTDSSATPAVLNTALIHTKEMNSSLHLMLNRKTRNIKLLLRLQGKTIFFSLKE